MTNMEDREPLAPNPSTVKPAKESRITKVKRSLSFDRRRNKPATETSQESRAEEQPHEGPVTSSSKPVKRSSSFGRRRERDPVANLRLQFPDKTDEEIRRAIVSCGGALVGAAKVLRQSSSTAAAPKPAAQKPSQKPSPARRAPSPSPYSAIPTAGPSPIPLLDSDNTLPRGGAESPPEISDDAMDRDEQLDEMQQSSVATFDSSRNFIPIAPDRGSMHRI